MIWWPRLKGAMMTELARRIAFTLGILLLYRLGSNIPLPGIDAEVWAQMLRNESGDLRSLLLFTGGVHRLAILALNLTPYISAAVILQLATIVCRPLRALNLQGERGREIIRKTTLGLTALLAAFQAYGIALAIEGLRNGGIVAMPKSLFVVSTVVTLTGGALLLAWFSEQITSRGIGNGIALILLAGSMSALREPVLAIRELAIHGLASQNVVLGLSAALVGITCLVVLIERAVRRFDIRFTKFQAGGRVFENLTSGLSIKLNPAGIIPAVLASWLLSILITTVYLAAKMAPHLVSPSAVQLITGRPLHLVLYGSLIFGCTLFYAAYLLDPERLAGRLREQGGTIASVEHETSIAAYLDYAFSRIAVMGAAYLTLICLLPDIVMWYAKVPVYFGGQVLLILVCTTVDLEAQLRGSLVRARRG
jgi:preprotein translocase subunit SecY